MPSVNEKKTYTFNVTSSELNEKCAVTELNRLELNVKDWLYACASSLTVDFMPVGIHAGVLGLKYLGVTYSPNTPVFAFIPYLLEYEKENYSDRLRLYISGGVPKLGASGLEFARLLESEKVKRIKAEGSSEETNGRVFSFEEVLTKNRFHEYEVRSFKSCFYLYLDSSNWLVVKKAGQGLISLHLASNEKPFPSIGRSSIYLPDNCLLKDFLAAVDLIRSIDYGERHE